MRSASYSRSTASASSDFNSADVALAMICWATLSRMLREAAASRVWMMEVVRVMRGPPSSVHVGP